jgi:predicted Zn-dependent peptidase
MEVRTLSNGMKVVEIPLKGLSAVTIEVFCKIGSKYERVGEHGLSHFLEHMAFKGTDKRLSGEEVNKEIDTKGADYNAGTGHETTSYYIKTVKENLEWGVELLSDIVLNPKIRSEEVKKEKGVIIEEIKMYQDNPAMGMADTFWEHVLGKSPIGCWDIAGTVEEIDSYNEKDIIEYRKKYLDPKRMVVVIAGDVGKGAGDIVNQYFGEFENKAIKLPEIETVFTEVLETRVKKAVEQGHFCIGVEGLKRNDDRRYALKLLEIVMAGNTSSRLFSEIREKRGWAYYVHLIGDSFEEVGMLGVQSGVMMSKIDEAVSLTEEILVGLKDTISNDELLRAKSFYRGKVGLMMDRSDFWSQFVGERLLLENKISNIESEIKAVEAVDLEAVRHLAGELLRENRFRKLIWHK